MADLHGLSLERLHEVSAKLGRVTHYELLGVEPTADTETIRRAWHTLAMEFHPDRFFRKDLGPHKAQLEAVFRYLMRVLDTLKPREARRAYDLSLRSAESTERCPWTPHICTPRHWHRLRCEGRTRTAVIRPCRPVAWEPSPICRLV